MRNKRKKPAGKDTAMQYEWPIEPPEPWVDHSEEHQRQIEKFIDMEYSEWRACCVWAEGRRFNKRLTEYYEAQKNPQNSGTNQGSPLPPPISASSPPEVCESSSA
jgi:hypothetical protein